ncbi:hypothetical protein [Neobacillus jeddahensis]|uniref:hypothetical protein n=1 Tax=Neobacillus jeddahensis TaxID=1461580 RepID=UPI000694EEC1|nr:hypothetical protein [Neobacillus jeddahensis]
MAASWRVNVLLGFFAFLFTFLFSMVNNTWQTSLIRAGFGFLLFFLLGYMVRLGMYQNIAKKNPDLDQTDMTNRIGKQQVEQSHQGEKVSKDQPSFQSIPLGAIHHGVNENEPKQISH